MKNDWQEERDIFEEDCCHAIAISRQVLRQLMEENQDTEYGRRYGFAGIREAAEYQARVPISDYGDYEEAILRMRQGEKNLITAYEVKHYIMTSGSTGKQKWAPLTRESLRRYVRPLYYAAYANVEGIEQGQYLHTSVFRMDLTRPEQDTIISAAYFRELHDQGSFHLEERYLGGEELLFSKGMGLIPYAKWWIALLSPGLAGIQAFFLYDILLFARWFEENWQGLLFDLKNRRIPEEIPLDDRVREALYGLPAPEAAFLEYVENECAKGMKGIIRRLFCNAGWVNGVGGSAFAAQEPALRYYLGDIPIHYFGYAASEGLIAIATELESNAYVLMPRSGFYEFIPYGTDGEESQPKCIWELEEGQMYEILMTTFSGFYRYRLNDVVKVTGFYGQAPVLEVCFRKNQAIGVAGEKVDMQMLARVMEKLGKRFDLQIYEYSVCDDKTQVPGRYLCFLELAADGMDGKKAGARKRETGVPEEELGRAMDEILKSMHEDYRDVREIGSLGSPQVFRVSAGAHASCKQQYGARQAQNKPMQYLSDPDVIRYMRERIL